jgi:peptidoglycan/LPS O-acetylase OafA/YrhL
MNNIASGASAAGHSMVGLTGLRGLAALWVLVYHAWVYVTPQEILFDLFGETIRVHVFFSLGWSGVQLLFVLSGFLLTLPYARANAGLAPRPKVGGYLRKRIARVFPAYYLQLVLLVLITFAVSGVMLITSANAMQYLLMLFVPPPIGVGAPGSVNGVWWTLPFELSFYLVLPFISGLAHYRRIALLLGLSLAGMVAWRYFVLNVLAPIGNVPIWTYQLPGSMDAFSLGMVGAVLHVHFAERKRPTALYTACLKLLLLCSVPAFAFLGYWMAEDYAVYWSGALIHYLWTPLFGTAVLVVILNCAHGGTLVDVVLGNRAVFYLGTVSYGLYLWHLPIGAWLLKLPLIAEMESYPFPRLALLMFLGSLCIASLSWYLVEARAIGWARRPVLRKDKA